MDVCIVMGSKSDLPVGQVHKILERFNIDQIEGSISSGPQVPRGDNRGRRGGRLLGLVGIAGVAAALPGVIASMTSRPVIGVPVGGKVPYDSLLSIVQMPPVPVATVGVDRGDNAGALAVQILAARIPN